MLRALSPRSAPSVPRAPPGSLVSLAGGVLLAGLVLLGLAAGGTPHDPIHIDGDADVCDDEEGDGFVGRDDGIVNCHIADGSPQRPYIIEGWEIQLQPDAFHDEVCADAPQRAALRICHTSKNILIRDVEVRVVSDATSSTSLAAAEGPEPAAVAVTQGHVRIVDSILEGGGTVLFVNGQPGQEGAATSLEAVGVDIRRPAEQVARLGPPGGDGTSDLAEYAAIVVRHADANLQDIALDAEGRTVGILVEGAQAPETGQTSFEMHGARIAHAGSRGLALLGVDAHITGSTFTGNGPVGASATEAWTRSEATTPAYDITASFSRIRLHDNTFAVVGTGVALEKDVQGSITENRFMRHEKAAMPPVAVRSEDAVNCLVALHYNSFEHDTVVRNGASSCFVDARLNWWGSNGPHASHGSPWPQLQGDILADPWLREHPERLPQIRVDGAPSVMAYEAVTLHGYAKAGPDRTLQRIEASQDEMDWTGPFIADGTSTWSLHLDLGTVPPGARTFWIRACDGRDCGVPAAVEVMVRASPLEPVALLRADALVVAPGTWITLDASGSFSPQGHRITEYDFGRGWQEDPTLQVLVGETAQHVQLRVRDETGLESTNPAETSIRVSLPLHAEATPMALLGPTVALIVLAASRYRNGGP